MEASLVGIGLTTSYWFEMPMLDIPVAFSLSRLSSGGCLGRGSRIHSSSGVALLWVSWVGTRLAYWVFMTRSFRVLGGSSLIGHVVLMVGFPVGRVLVRHVLIRHPGCLLVTVVAGSWAAWLMWASVGRGWHTHHHHGVIRRSGSVESLLSSIGPIGSRSRSWRLHSLGQGHARNHCHLL